jgi:hypothetical protein
MIVRAVCLNVVAVLSFAFLLHSAVAQQTSTVDGGVQPATAVAPAAGPRPALGPRVKFDQMRTEVGDRVLQRLGMQMAVTTKIVQSGQVAHEGQSEVRSQTQRTVDAMQVAEGRAVQARVTFQLAKRMAPDSPNPQEFESLPTEGKTYRLTRDGEDLTVTDAEGAIPPLEEFKIVAESLDGIGRPNPLAQVLAGREVAVGERMFVPRETAKTLLGIGGPELGVVHKFELTLDRLAAAEKDAAPWAVFRVAIEIKPEDQSSLAVVLSGELAVEPATCRLMAVDLAGPVHISTIERTELGIYQYSMDGTLKLAMRSQYGRAE